MSGARCVVLSFLLASTACDTSAPTRPRALLTWADSTFGEDSVAWVVDDMAGGWTMPPVLDESHVYFERDREYRSGAGSKPPRLIALDRMTGKLKWASSIVAAENAAIAGDMIGAIWSRPFWGTLAVFERSTGNERYLFSHPDGVHGNVVSSGNRFVMMTFFGRAVAIDAASGSIAWDTDLSSPRWTAGFGVTLAGDAVITTLKHLSWETPPSDSGIVASLDLATGAVRWRVSIDPGIAEVTGVVDPAVISGDNVIVVTERHEAFAFDLATGARRWRFDAAYGFPLTASKGLATCAGRVFVPTGDLGLVALDAATGVVRWKRSDLRHGSLTGVHCSHGTVLVGSLLVLHEETGVTLASYPAMEPDWSDIWISSATRDAEWLYVATTRGFAKVHAP